MIEIVNSSRPFLLTVMVCLGTSASYAGIAACTTATAPPITAGSTATGTVINPTYNGTGNGCSADDMTFTNVTAGATFGGSGTNATATTIAADTRLVSTGDVAASGNTIGPIAASFDSWNAATDGTGTATQWTTSTTGAAGQIVGTITYLANANVGGAEPTNPLLHWAITGLVLSSITGGDISGGAGGDLVTIVETFCVSATTTVACAAGNKGTITETYTGSDTPTFACTTGTGSCLSATGATINFAGTGFTQIAISDVITIRNGSTTAAMDSFTNTFKEGAEAAPEPSSFILLGSALMGLTMIRVRKNS